MARNMLGLGLPGHGGTLEEVRDEAGGGRETLDLSSHAGELELEVTQGIAEVIALGDLGKEGIVGAAPLRHALL